MRKGKGYRSFQTMVVLLTIFSLLVLAKTLKEYLAGNTIDGLSQTTLLLLVYISGAFFMLGTLFVAFWLDRPLMRHKIRNVLGKTIKEILAISRCPAELQARAEEKGIGIVITSREVSIPDCIFSLCRPADLGALIEALLWADANEIFRLDSNSVFSELARTLVKHYSSTQIDAFLKSFRNASLRTILETSINEVQIEMVLQQNLLEKQYELDQLRLKTEEGLKQIRKLSGFTSLTRYLLAKLIGRLPRTQLHKLFPKNQLPKPTPVTELDLAELTGRRPQAEIPAA
ncbi:MAG TPA: hypothetical protein VJG65_03730 [Patescibacteria group bacterium]|nr:hypothetical protein [Patescibacteria group bacterium]